MTFDEAITKFEQDANNYSGLVPMETVYEIVLDLRDEYAATVEMTQEQKKIMLNYSKHDSFCRFISHARHLKSETFGIMFTDDFKELSDNDLIKAWLHPETIKMIKENSK